jgi:hypothetical protein
MSALAPLLGAKRTLPRQRFASGTTLLAAGFAGPNDGNWFDSDAYQTSWPRPDRRAIACGFPSRLIGGIILGVRQAQASR